MFSGDDVICLMDCFQGDIFFPDQMRDLASDLCDHWGIEPDDYSATEFAPLIDKLLALSSVQRLTLADALEQAWYRGYEMNRDPLEIFSELGIELG